MRMASFSPDAIESLKKILGVEEVREEEVERLVSGMTRDEAVGFRGGGCTRRTVYHMDEVVRDPPLIARDMFVEVHHPKAGSVRVPNFPVKFSEMPAKVLTAAPLLGQHNKEILIGILGFTEERIEELEKSGVIFTEK